MRFEWFVARRLSRAGAKDKSISGPIIRLAIAAVALSFVVMLITVAVGTGLKVKIRDKVIGFNRAHPNYQLRSELEFRAYSD